MIDVRYWSYIGTFYLLLLTWQDYKNNMKVDGRRNYFMLGLSVSIVSHVPTGLVYKLALVAILMLLYYFMKKIKAIGQADINTLSWLFLGWGLISPFYLAFYTAVFGVLTLLYFAMKRYIFKYEYPVPFYSVFLISYVPVCFLLGLY